ncbi:MAG: carboxypeptidase-like regulatory domain-containing protein, partial [Candidatus Marinimicrobia bacterium]|nr:carboxypeptidase-like regulatory domain-containing protein [Candidatus Neomarinimicrobiota bacterium]
MNMKNYFSIVLTLIIAQTVFGGITGKIAGQVIDAETGDAMIGCNILIEGTSLGAATDFDGNYYILNIPPGKVAVKAMMIGYSTIRMTDVEVAVDLTSQVDFALSTEVIEGQEITVVAEKKMINKDLTASTAIISSEDFELLPVTEISEALEMQAGYVDGHLRGGRKGEVAYWIDGVPVTDVYDGGTVVEINKNAVEEMQLISGAFNAEYGQAMSGIVNIVTKDGSNDFGGNASIYSGDFVSQHNDIFMNVDEIDMLSTRNIEGSIEGSIIRDKLFYYINGRYIHYKGIYEGQRRYKPHSLVLIDQDTSLNYQTHIVGSDWVKDSSLVSEILGPNAAAYFDTVYALLQSAHPDPAGDNEYVPMDWNEKLYGQLKLVYKLSPLSKIKYTIINDNVDYQEYDRAYKYNPDGILTRNRNGL